VADGPAPELDPSPLVIRTAGEPRSSDKVSEPSAARRTLGQSGSHSPRRFCSSHVGRWTGESKVALRQRERPPSCPFVYQYDPAPSLRTSPFLVAATPR